MNKTPTYIIVIRYLIVAVILYGIWTGNSIAIKGTLTLVIFHSEFLYIANRLREIQAYRQAVALKEGLAKAQALRPDKSKLDGT